MNSLLVFTVLFAGACMADVSHVVGKPVAILSSHQDVLPDGTWINEFASEDGIAVKSEGLANGEARGSYSYTGPDGPVDVIWTAGQAGFIATGSAIPAIPEAIVRSLEYIKAHPYVEKTKP